MQHSSRMNSIQNEKFSLKEEKSKQNEKFLSSIYPEYKLAAKSIILGYDLEHPSMEITKKYLRLQKGCNFQESFCQFKKELKEALEKREEFLKKIAEYLK